MVGAVVNGALIFRGSNSVIGRNVTGGGIYSNQFVGRVINGYAIYEKISTRTKATDVAPDNYNTCVVDEEDESKVTKTYTYSIDTIDRSKTNNSANLLDVNYTAGTITVPDAQALYVMSLITQSLASTAYTSDSEIYKEYSPSYGYYNYLTGVARLGDYTGVGCGTTAAQPDDYSQYAYRDSVNNYYSTKQDLVNAPTPYIIYRYTKAYGTDNVTSKNYPARKMTSDNSKFWDITLSKSNTFASMDSFKAFRGIGSVGIYSKNVGDATDRTAFKVATFNGNGNTINLHISLSRYERNQENYYHYQPKSLTQSISGDDLGTVYGHDGADNIKKLLGLGLFDCVMVKNDSTHEYQFKNYKLQGIIEDKVYGTDGSDITGTTNQTQLFCVGGVYGKRVNGNNYDVNFSGITFDGLIVSGAYSCGGLVGIDEVKSVQQMKIDGCNSTSKGISVTGGCFNDSNVRHGVGCFVGMTFWTRPYIDGDNSDTETVETTDISVSNITTFYDGDSCASVAGGLIGYTGSGAEIKNINLKGLNSSSVIGSPKVLYAGGFIGFSQSDNAETKIGNVVFDNCTLNDISVQAKYSAAGFLARCGNTNPTYYPRAISISGCAVIGNSESKPEIKAYGSNENDRYGSGGFIADFSLNSAAVNGVIEDSYVTGYKIEGYNTGGIVGAVSNKPLYLKNIYVKDCDLITYNVNIGGLIGFSGASVSGYNLKIDGVAFSKRNGDDYTSGAGIVVGKNNGNANTLTYRFIGIGAYNSIPAKVPTSVVKGNAVKNDSFYVFADYLNASATDLTNGTGYASTFGDSNNSDLSNEADEYPLAPFLTVNPRMAMGTNEYITGDGAGIGETIGNAGAIYAAAKEGTSNRRYKIDSTNKDASTNKKDSDVLANYIADDGAYKDGVFKISTASDVFGENFDSLTGVDDFAMLVINDDSAKADDITPFIKSYIRLVTNAAGSANTNSYTRWYNKAAYSCGSTEIDKLYKVVINPCYYDAADRKFKLGTAGDQGLQMYSSSETDTNKQGKYYLDSAKADSESSNHYQFSLIDVQFKDPTDQTKIAYHLYVPVYTQKTLTAEFSAVSMSETKYYRSSYAQKIASELESGKSASNPSQLVESTNEWTTTFIRYTYPKNQVPNEDWNYDKKITISLDSNFNTLPAGTELVLVDPNANADKFYRMTLDGSWTTGTPITLNLSAFKDSSGNVFTPQHLSAIRTDPNATGTQDGKQVLYEDYYISMYVPKVEGLTHSVRFSNEEAEMSHVVGDNTFKANINQKLNSMVILGDLFEHKIVDKSFEVQSGDGTNFGEQKEMKKENNVLKTKVKATVQIKNQSAGAYLANSNVYHSFFITLTSHEEDHRVSDTIYGISAGYIKNTTTYSYTKSNENHTQTITNNSSLGINYIELDTGSIIQALYDPQSSPVLTIEAETEMEFTDVKAFPYNPSGNEENGVGTQVSIKSSLAYRPQELRFSALNVFQEDPDGAFYYSTKKNNVELSFNAVPTDDETDEIGYKTNNRSLLGVNGKYGTSHPVIGRSMYNVDDIVDYDRATDLQYTIELYKKVTDENTQMTRYVKVDDISQYMTDVNLVDTRVNLTADKTADSSRYVYTGPIDHGSTQDNERMFEAAFSCNVLTGDAAHNKYANYRIVLTAQLIGPSNSTKEAYLVYTNAKIDPTVIDEIP
jgi:hypothetical protein